MKAIIYARHNSFENPEDSFYAQLEVCREYAKELRRRARTCERHSGEISRLCIVGIGIRQGVNPIRRAVTVIDRVIL